jgi:hypothetical protein
LWGPRFLTQTNTRHPVGLVIFHNKKRDRVATVAFLFHPMVSGKYRLTGSASGYPVTTLEATANFQTVRIASVVKNLIVAGITRSNQCVGRARTFVGNSICVVVSLTDFFAVSGVYRFLADVEWASKHIFLHVVAAGVAGKCH